MSRHFVWLIPVTNLGVFLALGLLGWVVDLGVAAPRWLAGRARLVRDRAAPVVLVAFPRIYTLAWLAVTLGWPRGLFRFSSRIPGGSGGSVQVSFPVALGILLFLGGIALG